MSVSTLSIISTKAKLFFTIERQSLCYYRIMISIEEGIKQTSSGTHNDN